jgi:aspartyl aminopeptidase
MSMHSAQTRTGSHSSAPHSAATAATAAAHAAELSDFVMAAPSSYHAAYAVRERLAAVGFEELSEEEAWALAPGGRYVVVRDGAVIAFAVPADASAAAGAGSGDEPEAGDADGAAAEATAPAAGASASPLPPFRVLGAHTDSPAFKLGPRPEFTAERALQAGVEIYGGPLLNSWLDRELCFAGRLVLRDGSTVLARTGPIARIPQLAIHLDRKANEGLTLDRQRHTQPVIGLADMVGPAEAAGGTATAEGAEDGRGTDGAEPASLVLRLLAESAEVAASEVAAVEAVTFPVQAPALFGAHSEFLASPRLDNLSSVWAGTSALEAVSPETLDSIAVLAAFDHEEVGSETRSGASGPFLADVLERISLALGASREEHLRALAGSVCLSSDAGHAVHPNYPGHHDPVVRPRLGGGPLLKINAQQRYATDAVGTAVWARACEAAGVEYQEFVSNNTVPCGSTIGPLTATRLGMTTVDVGLALWSMHSAREMCAIADLTALRDAVEAFFHG